ncbi:class I SAM-dependent methyltransferase [Paenibacillus tarimensis]
MMIRDKYEFLLSLSSLEYEIKQLTNYARVCSDCYDLLKHKLDELCRFMTCERSERQWLLWEGHDDIRAHACELREASVHALCDVEKYQALHICGNGKKISDYLDALALMVRDEFEQYRINETSKVLFIGSGAFPTSALTIAKEAGAEVMCLDIDPEAVELGRAVACACGLEPKMRFSDSRIGELPFGQEATHIIVASLVPNKLEVLGQLKETARPEAKIAIRYGNGIKSVFNYPLEEELLADWQMTQSIRTNAIYDTMVLERSVKGMAL